MKKLSEVSENFNKELQENIENMGYLAEAKDDNVMAEFTVRCTRVGDNMKIDMVIHNNKVVASKTIKLADVSKSDPYNKAFAAVDTILKK